MPTAPASRPRSSCEAPIPEPPHTMPGLGGLRCEDAEGGSRSGRPEVGPSPLSFSRSHLRSFTIAEMPPVLRGHRASVLAKASREPRPRAFQILRRFLGQDWRRPRCPGCCPLVACAHFRPMEEASVESGSACPPPQGPAWWDGCRRGGP